VLWLQLLVPGCGEKKITESGVSVEWGGGNGVFSESKRELRLGEASCHHHRTKESKGGNAAETAGLRETNIFDGIAEFSELTERGGGIFDRINKINRIGGKALQAGRRCSSEVAAAVPSGGRLCGAR
jgi:hypothetical protein